MSDCQYLAYELDRERDLRRQYEATETERYNARREQWRQDAEETARSADSWREALHKQAALCWREFRQFPDGHSEDEDYFAQSAKACELGVKVWHEVAAPYQAELSHLRERIARVERAIELAVAARIEAGSERDEYAGVAQAIRDDEDPDSWLQW